MGKAVTRGQALELVGRFGRDVDWDDLSSFGMQAVIDLPPKELKSRLTVFLKNGAPKLEYVPLLKLINNNVVWPVVEHFDPRAYFEKRAGLDVSGQFHQWILSKAKPAIVNGSSGKSYDLSRPAYYEEVIEDLGVDCKFTNESELCTRLAQMIDRQPNGEASDFQTDRRVNVFFVAELRVSVWRDYEDKKWNIHAWPVSGHGNETASSSRIFSRI